MKAFHFPLQAVLTVRENQENKALEAFGHAQANFHRVLLRHNSTRQALDEALEQRRQTQTRAASSQELQQLLQGLRAIQRRLRDCEAELEKAKTVVAARSRDLIEARKHREVIERVFEKQHTRHRIEAGRAEQKALDDLAALKSVGNLAFRWK